MTRQRVLCLFLTALVLVNGQTIREQTCSKDENSAEIQSGSTAMLGGILSFNDKGSNGFGCGKPSGSMQALEAIRWVLDLLNKKDELLNTEYLDDYYVPGVTLGMKVINNCGSIEGSVAGVGRIYQSLNGDDTECSRQSNKMMFGIVGGSTSDQSMEMSLAMQPHEIPLISYQATAPSLTTSGMYPNFMRTVAPDSLFSEVIIKLMVELDWKFVTVVYDSGTFGREAKRELHERMVEKGLCLTLGIPVDGFDLSDGNMNNVLTQVLSSEATGVVVFGDESLMSALIRRANDRISDTGKLQWIAPNFPIDSTLNVPYMRGLISITSAYRFIVEFEDHWVRIDNANPSPENPWLKDWFEEKYDCSFSPVGSQKDCQVLENERDRRKTYQQDQFVEPAVMAVFTYAKALRMAQKAKCSGSGACAALVNMDRKDFYENYLKKVDFTFTSDERVPSLASRNVKPYLAAKHLSFSDQGDIENPSFYIWNYNDVVRGRQTGAFKFTQIGSYIENYLDFDVNGFAMYDEDRALLLRPHPTSLCPGTPCSPCLGLPSDTKYFYKHGDIIINGIFSLHDEGQSPMSCGKLKSLNQVMYIEAMIYALEQINNDNTILPNVKLGGLGLDDCSNRLVGPALISKIQRGTLVVHDAMQNTMSPRKVEAYTAAHTSPLTDTLATMMNHIKRPLVGYRAGSPMLDNQMMYPFFIRSAPFVREEIRAIILMLKYYNWMQVQAVTSDDSYAMDAIKLFRSMAAKEGICVVATHNIHDTKTAASDAVQGLGLKQDVPVTVAIMDTYDQHRLLEALHSNFVIRSRLTLIASTGWGTKLEVPTEMEPTARGVLSLSLRHSPLQSFQDYLRKLDARSHTVNPWFREWFMAAYDCQDADKICDYSKVLNDGSKFDVMYEVESVMNAVKALALGIDDTLKHYCGDRYTTICSTYANAVDKGTKFMEMLRKVQFSMEDVPENIFQFIGSTPAIPFEVYSYEIGNYAKIGTIRPWTNSVSMTPSKGPDADTINSKCPQPCIECLYMFNHMNYIYSPGDIMLGAMFNVHYAGTGLFTCGDIRTHNGAMYTEAFNFAVEKINAGFAGVKLNGVKLGYLGFDGCSNPTRSQAIINRVSSDSMILGDGAMNFPDIMSWITYDSETTRDAALFLQQLATPIVSPGATSPEFEDLDKFTTLFRTTSSDSVIAKGMASFANKMGWNYVFVLNSPDASNRESARMFREYLKGFGICVLAQYEFVTDGNMEVIMSSLVSATSPVVAVFAEPDQHIENFLKTKNSVLFTKEIEFIANRPWTPFASDLTYRSILANSVFFKNSAPTISDFDAYLNSRDASASNNPWLPQIYAELFDCDYPGMFTDRTDCRTPFRQLATSTEYSQDIWTLSTINAVYSLAQGFHLTLIEKCGTNYNGVCSAFLQDSDTRSRVMAHMDEMKFTDITATLFEFIKREAAQGFKLVRYRSDGSTQEEGRLSASGELSLGDMANLLRIYELVKPTCDDNCQICKDVNANALDFSFIPGDLYIVGMFDVHKQGSDPYSCGEINNEHGVQLLEAFHFALNYVNNKKGIFSNLGLQIGGIGLDMCQSATRAANLVANLHSGKTILRKSGTTITPRQIDAYIATMDTESSIRVGDILSQLLVPQISYGATGMELLDRKKYDYFMRSVPADDKMGRAIISYLKKFGYNNIQVIKSFDEIGKPGAEEFERLAEINLVCITKTYLLGQYGDIATEAHAVIQSVLGETRAQVIVLWMKDPLPVLKAINNYPNADLNNTLFVATDKWGFNPDHLKMPSLQKLLSAKNLIILDVETADVPGYDDYLADKTPDNYFVNPWFKEMYDYYQEDCGPDPSKCNKFKTIPRLDHYVQDPYVLYVVNAVFSAAKAVEGAVNELCRTQVSGVCNSYDTSGVRRQKVLSHLQKVNFVDDTHQPFFYTADGQSDRGFHFYNITEGTNDLKYENVGSYNDSHFLKLDITYSNNFFAQCDPLGLNPTLETCVCPFKPDLPTRFMKKDEGGRGLTLVYVGDIHQEHPDNKYQCGKINTGADLQRMLAFFYAIEHINANVNLDISDSIRLDGVALDTCTNSLRLGQDVYNILSGNELCDSDEKGQIASPSSIAAFIVDKDKNAIPVSTMLSNEGITSISPTATHIALDDPYLHGTFLRTQGSSQELVDIILQVSDRLGWNMMGAIYSDTPAHRGAKEALLRQARYSSSKMCIGTLAPLPLNATEHDAHEALDAISRQVGVTGVVLFVEPEHFRLLMHVSEEMGSTGIVWIVPNSWPGANKDMDRFKAEISSSIWIESKTSLVKGFMDYMKSLSLKNRMGIPDDWFEEIYQTLHKCKILDLENRNSRLYSDICTGDEVITDNMLIHDPATLHVILSVYSVAYGLNDIKKCRGTNLDVAACLQLQEKKNELIYDGILNAGFEVPEDMYLNGTFRFSYNRDGNGESGYMITTHDDNGITIPLGEYTSNGLLFESKNYENTMSFSEGGSIPSSECASGARCKCYGPSNSEYYFSPDDVDNLENVQVGQRYRDPDSGDIIKIVDIPGGEDRFQDAWAIIVLALAALGAVVSLALFVYLLVMYPVRGGTSILGYIVSFGIFLMYIMVIAFIYHADKEVCALRRFGLGVVYAIVYSALLVKLVDCCRVRRKNDSTYSAKYSKLGRPLGLFFITVFLILIQVMINAQWLIMEEPDMERVFYKDMYWPRCTPDDFYDEGLVLSLCYVIALIVLAFCLGIYTFTLNSNHRESRWIFGIIILSIPCWVIWCSVATIGAYKVRDAAVAVGLLINASFVLLLMPVRKLYLLNKYNKMIEEEEKQMVDGNSDYGSVYGRQYDNRPQLHTGSVRGSSIAYAASQPRNDTQHY